MVKGLKNAYLMHFSSLLFWFLCRVCYYLKCSSFFLSTYIYGGKIRIKRMYARGHYKSAQIFTVLVDCSLLASLLFFFWQDRCHSARHFNSHAGVQLHVTIAWVTSGYIDTDKLVNIDWFTQIHAEYFHL